MLSNPLNLLNTKQQVLNNLLLLDEVCSYKPPSESIQNSHISKSNASDGIYSHISQSNASDVINSHISKSNAFDGIYSHTSQSNASDVICSHISESNASDVSCSHDISVPNDSYETCSNSKSNTSDVSCSHYISKPNAPDATCSHISKSITSDVSCPHVFSEAENSDPLFSHHDINSVASSKVSSHRIPKSHAFSNVNSAPKPSTFSQTSIASHVTHLRQKHADVFQNRQIDKGRRNRKMETQFNRHHGTRRRVFQINQKVYVRDFRYSPPQWTSGRILKRRGSVMYVVDVEGLKWVRHANHILEHAAACHETERLNTLWEIFLDSFDMENVATKRNAQLEQNPVRRSMRKRRRPEILQVDPKRRAYVSEDRYQ
ncbi:Gag-Pol polyprotein [Schistosoma japonicum]|uniref:Gag-Pol polyprotein n=1 Tax=Schistosoma japonicum TaxID=6182 RepID=A0A4Z2D398_SCHJA|nr:Gag-Pol polyprotein [Schistosoma japonicum]